MYGEVNNQDRARFPVLLIDDDPVFTTLIGHYLTSAGFTVTGCQSAEEGLQLLEKKRYRLIVCDWLMPGMSGLEFCRHIRTKEKSSVYLMFLTSQVDDDALAEGLNAGADDYIRKGAGRQEIIARLNTGVRILKQQIALNQTLMRLSQEIRTDPLTGAFNRRFLQETIVQEMERNARFGTPLSLIMCDIDHFKAVNDTYGHAAGDDVLKAAVKIITQSLREALDLVFRLGGEEFLVLLPNTLPNQARTVAQKLWQNFQAFKVVSAEQTIAATCSFGVSGVSETTSLSFEVLLEQADQALYQSKQQGRNRVTLYESE